MDSTVDLTAAVAEGSVTQGKTGNGDYTATPLAPSSSWTGGGSSGSFAWSYPFRVPPAAAGPQPQLAVSYDSGSVDGRTFTTNNQPSVLGEGFELTSSYVERTYLSCSQDGHPARGDLCWRGERLRLVLNGKASDLIPTGDNTFRLKSDDGSSVERLTGVANGDNNGEHWRLTTTDGTEYTFGMNRLPGWESGAPETNSAWTVPVYSDDAGDPAQADLCKKDTFDASWCHQAWRWNLDLVADTNGNASTYWYSAESNNYARAGKENSPAGYDRGGYLKRIDYGLRRGGLFTGGGAAVHAPQQVRLTYAERCLAETCGTLTETNKYKWPDVPFESLCPAPASEPTGDYICKDDLSPTFFTRKLLTDVTTRVGNGSGGYRDVDTWHLEHLFLDPGDTGDTTDQILWPTSIEHTGLAGETPIKLRPVRLVPSLDEAMGNRVDTTNDGIAPLIRPRLSEVISETGAIIDVTYSRGDCTPGDLPAAPATNMRRCFPVHWAPYGGDPRRDWFHKYVVTQVREIDSTSGEGVDTSYLYEGGAAWRYSADPLRADAYRTWSEWRGYGRVSTLKGNPDAPQRSMTTTIYFRGMDGDRDGNGGTKDIQVSGIAAPAIADKDEYAGSARETVVYNGRNRDGSHGAELSGTINTPWSKITASHTYGGGQIDGKTASPVTYDATMVRTQQTTKRTRVTSESTPYSRSTTEQVISRDSHGLPLEIHAWVMAREGATPTEHRCSRITYAHNSSVGIIGLVARKQVLSVNCANADSADLPDDASRPGDVVSDVVNRYDDADSWANQAPTRGRLTDVWRANGYTSTNAPVLQNISTSTHDALGRPLTVADSTGATTTTSYVPGDAGVPQSVTVTNAREHRTVTTLDPAWGTAVKVLDPNDKITERTYDALGRVTAIWTPQTMRDWGGSPDYKFSYHMGGAPADEDGEVEPTWIATSTVNADNVSYTTKYDIIDALLRPRQTQAPATSTGRLLTATFYNDRGLPSTTITDLWDDDAAPSGTPAPIAGGSGIQVDTTYDGASRPVQIDKSYTVPEQDSTGSTRRHLISTTSYTGDSVATRPPAGGMGQRSITDALGRVIEKRQYATENPDGATFESNKFTFDPRGRQRTMTGPDGAVWTYGYDLHGRQVSAADPDRGTTTTSYDNLDRIKTTIDAANRAQTYTYDVLGRKTGLYTGSVVLAANRRAGWTYDAVQKGQPAAATRYVGGESGQKYVRSVAAYDSMYRPKYVDLTLPTNDVLVSGAQIPSTLRVTSLYNRDGTLKSTAEPAVAGLPSETSTLTYDSEGLGLPIGLSGTSGVVLDTLYDALGDLAQTTLGVSSSNAQRVWLDRSYDGLGRQTRLLSTETSGVTHLLDVNYAYDDASRITAITDKSYGATDYQCFTYGSYQRLDHAWTPKTDNCDPVSRTPTNMGGKAPYWSTYTYKPGGLRSTFTKQAITSTGTPTSTSYTYDGTCTNGSTQVNLGPHVLNSTKTGTTTRLYCANVVGDTTTSWHGATQRTTAFNHEGKLETITAGTAKYSHIYDADGNLLIKRPTSGAAGKSTLYVGATEVQVTQTGTGTSATYKADGYRYYTHAGETVAVRTSKAGISGTKLSFLAADHHGTVNATWDSANVATRTKRYTDPFGNARGTNPTWVDDKRFLGKSHDTGTGITHIGAREFDPALGRFLSVDPLLDTSDPQSVNGYTYADNDPINHSDPSGLECADRCGGGVDSGSGGDDGGGDDGGGDDGGDSGGAGSPPDTGQDGGSNSGSGTNTSGTDPSSEDRCEWEPWDGGGTFGGRLRDTFGGMLSGGATGAEFSSHCGTIWAPVACYKYIKGGGVRTGSDIAGWANKKMGTDTGTFSYLIGEILGIPIPGASAASAAAKGPKAIPWITRILSRERAVVKPDHIVLGKSIGLRDRAEKIGGRHLMNDLEWRESVRAAAADPKTRISVALDGVQGDGVSSRVLAASRRSRSGEGEPFDWEMAELQRSGRLSSVDFYEGGVLLDNPFS